MRRTVDLGWVALLGVCLATLSAAPAQAASELVWSSNFVNLSNETGLSGGYFEVEVWWDATSSDQVMFRFLNNGTGTPDTGVITDIYWDETVPDILVFEGDAFVLPAHWDTPASPPDFQGGQLSPDAFVVQASSDSDPPVAHNGIDAGEWLDFYVGLDSTGFADGEAALRDRLDAGDLRLGIHVQSIGEGSDWFYAPPVPVPPAAAIGLLGMGLMLARQARRRNRSGE